MKENKERTKRLEGGPTTKVVLFLLCCAIESPFNV